MNNLTFSWHSSIYEIDQRQWNALTGENIAPFFQWKWLYDLERSKSISPNVGWQPIHLAINRNDRLIAIAPLFLKSHSYGEFIFDQGFANLAHELRLNYYPKIIGMSPFSPVEGYKFFISKEVDSKEITSLLVQEIDKFAIKNNILSCNFLYVDPTWGKLLEELGYSKWINQQSIWNSNNHKNFGEYLESFNANQRRNIKRERKSIAANGIKIIAATGEEINRRLMENMYMLYETHCFKWGEWGSKYLSREFFNSLADPEYQKKIVVFIANEESSREPLGMSLCVVNNDSMWGRYWGATKEIDFLHFETCYYFPIEWALENNIKTFNPGAGGSHKNRRGFIANPQTSLHKWYDLNMNKILKPLLTQANHSMLNQINIFNSQLPFKIKGET